jgi:hypothetical protein
MGFSSFRPKPEYSLFRTHLEEMIFVGRGEELRLKSFIKPVEKEKEEE